MSSVPATPYHRPTVDPPVSGSGPRALRTRCAATAAAPRSSVARHQRRWVESISTATNLVPSEWLYPTQDAGDDTASLIGLHESIADLLASRGEWQQAYEHVRHALDLISAERAASPKPPYIPAQFREEVDRLRREHAEAREQAIRDALTASYNRRYLDQRLVALVEQQGSRADGLAVALVDLDFFKKVNDTDRKSVV